MAIVSEGELVVVVLEPPLQPITCGFTFPSLLPATKLLTLSCDYFILADTHSLQLWDSRYYTRQHHIKASIAPNSEVSCTVLVVSVY